MKGNRALKHGLEVVPFLVLVEIVHECLHIPGQVLKDYFLLEVALLVHDLLLNYVNFNHFLILLVLDEDDAFIQARLLVHHQVGRCRRLCKPCIHTLEGFLSVFARSTEAAFHAVASRLLGRLCTELGTRTTDHLVEVAFFDELAGGFVVLDTCCFDEA